MPERAQEPLLLLPGEVLDDVLLMPFAGLRTDLALAWDDNANPVLSVAIDGDLYVRVRKVAHGWKPEYLEDSVNRIDEDATEIPSFLLPASLQKRVRTIADLSRLTEDDSDAHADYLVNELGDLLESIIVFAGCGLRVTIDSSDANQSRGEISLQAVLSGELVNAARVFQAAVACSPGVLTVRFTTDGQMWTLDAANTGVLHADNRVNPCKLSQLVLIAFLLAPEWCFAGKVDEPALWHSNGGIAPESLIEVASPISPSVSVVDAEILEKRKVAVAQWASENRFSDSLPNSRAAVLKHLDAIDDGLAGYYLLQFTNGECYVGQSQDIPRRVAVEHPRRFGDIESVRVRPDAGALGSSRPHRHLLTTERVLIHTIQNIQAPARNISDMTITSGTKNFLDLVSIDDQRRWLSSPETANRADGTTPSLVNVDDFAGAKHSLARLRADYPDKAAQVERIVGGYIARCIPFPYRTEWKYWSLSAVPSTKSGDWRRLVCLTASWTETLVITESRSTSSIVGFLQVADLDLFGEDETLRSYLSVVRRHPGTFDTAADYIQSGPGNTVLHAIDLDGLERLLDDTAVTRAAATAALNIMNKRGVGRVKDSHNPHLVDAALHAVSFDGVTSRSIPAEEC